MTARILVIGQQSSASTGLIRTLARNGDVCDLIWFGSRREARFGTRAARRFIRLPHPKVSEFESFGQALLERADSGRYDVAIPISDYQTWLLARHAADLRVGLVLPTLPAFDLANDKAATLSHAAALGIPTPRVWDWPHAPDLASLPTDIRFPVVVKARSGSGVRLGLRYANNPAQLQAAYLDITSQDNRVPTEDFRRPLICEFIPGFIHDACALAHEGEVVNVLTQVRQVMAPLAGGVGAVNITTHEPELAELAGRLLRSLQWNGPAQIEFKYDPRDGRYKLIELNPRLWGTLDLAIRAGMDFPRQIRDLALGNEVPRHQDYRVGMRYVFFSRALPAYVQLARTHGIGAVRDRRRYATTTLGLDLRDPLPGLWEIVSTATRTGKRLLGAVGRRIRSRGSPGAPAGFRRGGLPTGLINTLDRTGDTG